MIEQLLEEGGTLPFPHPGLGNHQEVRQQNWTSIVFQAPNATDNPGRFNFQIVDATSRVVRPGPIWTTTQQQPQQAQQPKGQQKLLLRRPVRNNICIDVTCRPGTASGGGRTVVDCGGLDLLQRNDWTDTC